VPAVEVAVSEPVVELAAQSEGAVAAAQSLTKLAAEVEAQMAAAPPKIQVVPAPPPVLVVAKAEAIAVTPAPKPARVEKRVATAAVPPKSRATAPIVSVKPVAILGDGEEHPFSEVEMSAMAQEAEALIELLRHRDGPLDAGSDRAESLSDQVVK
jgi:hypothetical protein